MKNSIMEMKKYKLGEIATVEISGVDKKIKDGEESVKLCNFVDVYYNWAITSGMEQDFMEATARVNEIERFKLKRGQVALTKDSETRFDIGIATYIADDFDNVILGYHNALITPNPEKLSGKYLNALLHTDYARIYFANNASGSGQRYALSVDALNNFPVPVIPLAEQKRIGDIFSTIDRKISLNRAINCDLETMAKQIYDYWFVQFDFPNENGRPYKSSGGKMVWNETLKREIPEGWKDCTLQFYTGRITNGLNPRKNFVLGSGSNYYVTIRSLTGTDIDWNNCDRCDDDALNKINNRSQLQKGDIIFSAIGTIGRTYFIQGNPNNWNISETSFTLRAKTHINPVLFYSILRSDEIQKQADQKAMGSTLRCLVMENLMSIPYFCIEKKIGENFATIVSPIYKKIYNNNKEIRELSKQRDSLLPLLMNGQVTIKD